MRLVARIILCGLIGCDAKPDEDETAPETTDSSVEPVDADADGATASSDCDDADPAVYPGAEEACNGVDDDCDGGVDEGLPTTTWWPDADGDSWGALTGAVEACWPPEATSAQSGDCDDTDPETYPGAVDSPGDGVDSNCDGSTVCESVTTFDGSLYLTGPTAAADGEAFCASYQAMSGDLLVYDSDLVDLHFLGCLCDAASLELHGNPALQSLDGLENLRRVGALVIEDCPSLTSLEGLVNLTQAGVAIDLVDLPLVTSVAPLANVVSVREEIGLANVGVVNLEGLGGVAGGLTEFTAVECTSLESLDGLAISSDPLNLYVYGNPLLVDVSALAGVRSVGEEGLWIGRNSSLPSYAGLDALEEVSGDAVLGAIGGPDLSGLGTLRTIGGSVSILADGMDSLAGLDSLETVGGTVDISGDADTVSLAGFPITELPNQLFLTDIPTTDGLEVLTFLGSSLRIDSQILVDVDGLSGLREVQGYLSIEFNGAISSLDGLYGVESIGGDLYIRYNPGLTDEDGWALVDAIGEENIDGEILIEGNGV